jgi:hypothetical protein
VVGNFFVWLLLNIQPNQGQKGYEEKRSDKVSEFVASLSKLGYEHDNCGSQEAFL